MKTTTVAQRYWTPRPPTSDANRPRLRPTAPAPTMRYLRNRWRITSSVGMWRRSAGCSRDARGLDDVLLHPADGQRVRAPAMLGAPTSRYRVGEPAHHTVHAVTESARDVENPAGCVARPMTEGGRQR